MFESVKSMNRRRKNEGEGKTIGQAKLQIEEETFEKEGKGIYSKKE